MLKTLWKPKVWEGFGVKSWKSACLVSSQPFQAKSFLRENDLSEIMISRFLGNVSEYVKSNHSSRGYSNISSFVRNKLVAH